MNCWAEKLGELLESIEYILDKILFTKRAELPWGLVNSTFGDFYLVWTLLDHIISYIMFMGKSVLNNFLLTNNTIKSPSLIDQENVLYSCYEQSESFLMRLKSDYLQQVNIFSNFCL